jgi:hypothetical protein
MGVNGLKGVKIGRLVREIKGSRIWLAGRGRNWGF